MVLAENSETQRQAGVGKLYSGKMGRLPVCCDWGLLAQEAVGGATRAGHPV